MYSRYHVPSPESRVLSPMVRVCVMAGTIAGIAALALTWTSLLAQKPTVPTTIDFARDIQPILRTHCYECHGPTKQQHGLRLDLRAVAATVFTDPEIVR